MDAAVAGLRARWGAAAPGVAGALALVPSPADDGEPRYDPRPDDRVIHTGFAALDAILGPGGLPTSASVAIRGLGSSGRTTLSLRVAAEAQAQGSVVAWLDLSRSFDPVEAVARGVRLEWLVVITPASLDEGLGIAGSLVAGRSVDLLVIDLPGGRLAKTDTPAKIADRLHRLAARARRAETLLLILDSPGPAGGLTTAVDQSTGIRLELARRSWVRLGRDVVGQRTEALVAHNRHGPPGRRAILRILYAEGGERDACLADDALLLDALDPPAAPKGFAPSASTAATKGLAPSASTAAQRGEMVPELAVTARNEISPADIPSIPAVSCPEEKGSAGDEALKPSPSVLLALPASPYVRSKERPGRARRTGVAPGTASPAPPPIPVHAPAHEAPDRETHHATSAPVRAAPAAPPGPGPTLRALPDRSARAGRSPLGSGSGHRRRSDRSGARCPARDAARERPPTRP